MGFAVAKFWNDELQSFVFGRTDSHISKSAACQFTRLERINGMYPQGMCPSSIVGIWSKFMQLLAHSFVQNINIAKWIF